MVRLLGIGDNTVDIYETEGMQYPGGNAVNVAVQARRAGATASYLGCLGRDALGRLVNDSLVDEGVDVSHVRWIDDPNPWSRIRHEGADRRFVGSNRGVRDRYNLGAADAAFIATHDIVHTSVHSDLDGRIEWLRKHARVLTYDYSEHWRRPGVAATFAFVDIAFLSASGQGEAGCKELLLSARAEGARMVVATRGSAGACALSDDRFLTVSAPPAHVIDTLGAGDGFIAGFLVAWARGSELSACLSRGARQAAEVCGTKGGFGHGVPIGKTNDNSANNQKECGR